MTCEHQEAAQEGVEALDVKDGSVLCWERQTAKQPKPGKAGGGVDSQKADPMSTTIPEKCPKCGDELLHSSDKHREFMCFTLVLKGGKTIEGGDCARRQRDQLAERVKRLEEAGDRMAAELNRQCAPHWEDALARLWRLAKTGGRPVDQAEASACAVIQDERREG